MSLAFQPITRRMPLNMQRTHFHHSCCTYTSFLGSLSSNKDTSSLSLYLYSYIYTPHCDIPLLQQLAVKLQEEEDSIKPNLSSFGADRRCKEGREASSCYGHVLTCLCLSASCLSALGNYLPLSHLLPPWMRGDVPTGRGLRCLGETCLCVTVQLAAGLLHAILRHLACIAARTTARKLFKPKHLVWNPWEGNPQTCRCEQTAW